MIATASTPETTRLTIHLCGVGGQALPALVRFLARRLEPTSQALATRETYGMAQRGGTVTAILDVDLPRMPGGNRSVLIGTELYEGWRGLSRLRPGDLAFLSTARLRPPGTFGSTPGADHSDADLLDAARDSGLELVFVEAPYESPWKVVQAAIARGAIP